MPVTIIGSIANYPASNPAITARILLQHGTVAINGAGAGSSVTMGSLNTASFTFSDTIAAGVYEVRYYTSTVELGGGTVWIESASTGTYKVDDPIRMAVYQQRLQQNLEAPKRALGDTSAEDFTWIVSNASSNAITATKVFEGQLTPTSVAGTFTYIGIVFGDYRWSFTPGTGDLPTVAGPVTYQLTDTLGNTGKLTIVMVEAAGTISSTVLAGLTGVVPTIISPWEPITRTLTLIRGNDYVDALGTAIKIAINVPSGLNVSTAIPTLYASHKVTSDKFVSVGTFYQVSGNNFVKFEISAIETIGKIADYYEFFIQAKAGSYLTTLVAESKLRLVKNIESV